MLTEVKRMQKLAGILKENDEMSTPIDKGVEKIVNTHSAELLDALARRSQDQEDIDAHDDVESILNAIADDLRLEVESPFMEDEMFSGEYSPQEVLQYTKELFSDMYREDEEFRANAFPEDDYEADRYDWDGGYGSDK